MARPAAPFRATIANAARAAWKAAAGQFAKRSSETLYGGGDGWYGPRGGAQLEAASPRRGISGWGLMGQQSPGAIPPGLAVVRQRSRYAVRNNAHAARAVDAWSGALIGNGIVVASTAPDVAARKPLQDAFALWQQGCDISGQMDWNAIQDVAARAMITDGEVFIQKIYTPAGLKLKLIPADLVDFSIVRELPDGFIYAGIEFSFQGEVRAYWILPRRADGFPDGPPLATFTPIRVVAGDILHIFRRTDPGQIRGIPWLSPVLLSLGELDGLLDALQVSARVAALHAGFLKDTNAPVGQIPYDGVTAGSVLNTELEPGALRVLPAGYDITFSSPNVTAEGVETAKLTIGIIAQGLGLPTHVLSGDLSGANYSSLREARNEWGMRVETTQKSVLIPQLVRPVWQSWIAYAAITGAIDHDSSDLAQFYAPSLPPVDALKEAEATAVDIAAGLTSRRRAVAERGGDVESLDEEIAADKAREKSLGLSFTAPQPKGVPVGTDLPIEPADDGGNPAKGKPSAAP